MLTRTDETLSSSSQHYNLLTQRGPTAVGPIPWTYASQSGSYVQRWLQSIL